MPPLDTAGLGISTTTDSSNDSTTTAGHKNDWTGPDTKKDLVVQTILSYCRKPEYQQQHKIFKTIADANGHVEIETISGGLTNYSYKVSTLTDEDELIANLYAKIYFSYPLWASEAVHHDLSRADCEFEMMKTFASVASTPDAPVVAEPYLCVDVGNDMKLLVTEWAAADEPFANQFMNGHVDLRIAPKIAQALAKLHSVEGNDANFNSGAAGFAGLFPKMYDEVDRLLDEPETTNRTTELAHSMGRDLLQALLARNEEAYESTDCLVHSDFHPYNILVEPQQADGCFGDDGSFVVCDWEMARLGPIGLDLAKLIYKPMFILIAHAMNGDLDAASCILNFIESVWTEYNVSLLEERGVAGDTAKEQELMREVTRSVVAWLGWSFFLLSYIMRFSFQSLPLDDTESNAAFLDAIGVLSLKFLLWGFGTEDETDVNNDELQRRVIGAVSEEVLIALRPNATKPASNHHRRSAVCSEFYRRQSIASVRVLG